MSIYFILTMKYFIEINTDNLRAVRKLVTKQTGVAKQIATSRITIILLT